MKREHIRSKWAKICSIIISRICGKLSSVGWWWSYWNVRWGALIHSPCPRSQYHRQLQLRQHMQFARRSEGDLRLQLLRCRRFPYRESALSSAFAREKKFENYLRSISATPSNCFRAVIDKYSRAKNSDKTVLRLLSSLHQEESSLVCQATLAAERDANS